MQIIESDRAILKSMYMGLPECGDMQDYRRLYKSIDAMGERLKEAGFVGVDGTMQAFDDTYGDDDDETECGHPEPGYDGMPGDYREEQWCDMECAYRT